MSAEIVAHERLHPSSGIYDRLELHDPTDTVIKLELDSPAANELSAENVSAWLSRANPEPEP